MKTKSKITVRPAPKQVSVFQDLLSAISSLRDEVAELKDRVAELESAQRYEQDRRGYEEQGWRYSGSHPASCACDRCLRRW